MKKKYLVILCSMIVFILASCNLTLSDKAIEQGKLSMANGDYVAAEKSFKLALDQGIKSDEATALNSILNSYNTAKTAFDDGKLEMANELMKNINSRYSDYSIKSDIVKLSAQIESGLAVSSDLLQASQYANDKKYVEAQVVLDKIDKSKLSADQKTNFDTIQNIVTAGKTANPQTTFIQVPSGYYVPSYYSGYVPTYSGDYLFPSATQYITNAYLDLCSKTEVALIRNEIYARRGYMFKLQQYKDYFGSKSWYSPNANFSDSMFNSIEKANIQTIRAYEISKGW